MSGRFHPAQFHVVGLLVALCIGQVTLWGFAFGLSYSAPEIDSAEQFVWAYSLQNGYWKHPPLPSWILHLLIELFGTSVALPFVATQICIVIALALVWRLGCEWMSPSRSLIAVALTSLVTYHNLGADCFNHSTVLLPFQAATVLSFFLATRRRTLRLWFVTGLFAGMAMLVKYVALLPIAGLLLYFALDRRLHTRGDALGLLVAASVFGAVLTPHLLWLGATDFLPFRYARSVAQATPGMQATLTNLADFLAIQLIRSTPFVLAIVIALWRRTPPAAPSSLPRIAYHDRLFIWVTAMAPLVGTMLIGVLSQTELQSRWGANGFLLIGLLLLSTMRQAFTPSMLRRTAHVVAAFQVVLCLSLTLGKTVLAEWLGIRTRANFPGAALAQRAHETWVRYTDVPLRIVVSDIWLGGNVIANSSQRVAVLIDGRQFKSPWISETAIDNCGALVLDDLTPDKAGRGTPNPALDRLMQRAQITGTWLLPWARPDLHVDESSRGVVRWGIVKPQSSDGCKLQ